MAVKKEAPARHSEANIVRNDTKDTRNNIRIFVELGKRFMVDYPKLAEFVEWGVNKGCHLEMWNLLLVDYCHAKDKAARLRIGGMIACLFIKSTTIRNSTPLSQIFKLFAGRDRVPIGHLVREIPGMSDYFASMTGRIVSTKREKAQFINPSKNGGGYLVFSPYLEGVKTSEYVHRAVGNTFLSRIEGKGQINHKDLDKTNNTLDNLEWVTQLENIRHYHENKLKGGQH
ncbi:HNH endonuclease signature motif containing protein [Mangrovibacterium lignilyticum]|uniref:HNH endonuclease signature motif containing protein n=1 Tax=Mangrovibacterium lignilyticum TaxID=2668052 RepID=UPI0019682269|nr:HNH endonuclease signature motif containing protein [Mangrovibacterium lignilyticum]